MHFTYSRHSFGLVQPVSGREGSDAELFFLVSKKKMNENPLTESATYWNKIILGNKSLSERCNNSAAQINAAVSTAAVQLPQNDLHSCSSTPPNREM